LLPGKVLTSFLDKENPLPYMEKWMSLNALQQANQETTSLAYLLDATKDDSAEAELDF